MSEPEPPPLHVSVARAALLGGAAGLCAWGALLALSAWAEAQGEPVAVEAGLRSSVLVVQLLAGAGLVLAADLARGAPGWARGPILLAVLIVVRLATRPAVVVLEQLLGGRIDTQATWAASAGAWEMIVDAGYPGYTVTWLLYGALCAAALLRLAPRRAPAWAQALAALLCGWVAGPLFVDLARRDERAGFDALAGGTLLVALPTLVGALALFERGLARRSAPWARALAAHPRPARAAAPWWVGWPVVGLVGLGLVHERGLRDLAQHLREGDLSAGERLIDAGRADRVRALVARAGAGSAPCNALIVLLERGAAGDLRMSAILRALEQASPGQREQVVRVLSRAWTGGLRWTLEDELLVYCQPLHPRGYEWWPVRPACSGPALWALSDPDRLTGALRSAGDPPRLREALTEVAALHWPEVGDEVCARLWPDVERAGLQRARARLLEDLEVAAQAGDEQAQVAYAMCDPAGGRLLAETHPRPETRLQMAVILLSMRCEQVSLRRVVADLRAASPAERSAFLARLALREDRREGWSLGEELGISSGERRWMGEALLGDPRRLKVALGAAREPELLRDALLQQADESALALSPEIRALLALPHH